MAGRNRVLRSERPAAWKLQPVVELPRELRGTTPSAKRVKRENETGMFAEMRRERGSTPVDVDVCALISLSCCIRS